MIFSCETTSLYFQNRLFSQKKQALEQHWTRIFSFYSKKTAFFIDFQSFYLFWSWKTSNIEFHSKFSIHSINQANFFLFAFVVLWTLNVEKIGMTSSSWRRPTRYFLPVFFYILLNNFRGFSSLWFWLAVISNTEKYAHTIYFDGSLLFMSVVCNIWIVYNFVIWHSVWSLFFI